MIGNFEANRLLWVLTGILALAAALAGLLVPGIYAKVVGADFLPGVFAQDIINLVAAVVILWLCFGGIKEGHLRKQLVVLSGVGYLAYSYGVYVIERYYTILYLLYLAVLGLAFYAIVYAVSSLRRELFPHLGVPLAIRNLSLGLLWLTPAVLYPLWLRDLWPLIQSGRKIEFFYATYILDLCFVLPLFVILGLAAFKNKGLGLLMTPVLFLTGFALLLPGTLAEVFKALRGIPVDLVVMGPFAVLGAAYLLVGLWYLRNLRLSWQKAQ